MKIVLFALMALMLSACSTLNVHTTTPTSVTMTTQPPAVTPKAVVKSVPTVASNMLKKPVEALSVREVNCMADAMYFEARGEGDLGMVAVGYVISNRMKSKRFPKTACGVVHQAVVRRGRIVRNACQFGWYCDGKPEVRSELVAYRHCQDLAKLVLLKMPHNPVGHALYFHESRYHLPRHLAYTYMHRIGHQVFYDLVAKT